MVGSADCSRDWLLLGRRGSGALELLAGLWCQNRDRSERSSFESDDYLLSEESANRKGLNCHHKFSMFVFSFN
jgi:hypothetical protein